MFSVCSFSDHLSNVVQGRNSGQPVTGGAKIAACGPIHQINFTQIAEKVIFGSDRKVSQYTMHWKLLQTK